MVNHPNRWRVKLAGAIVAGERVTAYETEHSYKFYVGGRLIQSQGKALNWRNAFTDIVGGVALGEK